MKLMDQKTKGLMEDCKKRAWDAGLKFDATTLEYIISNDQLNEVEPKIGVPTLYDYWVDDVGIIKKKKMYSVLPGNANELALNTRPAVSLYNVDNPDWMNVMIFYHVLGHFDFFQNNKTFSHTWDYDFMQKALTGKRTMRNLRNEHGRWVDYAIEWSRSIDNLVRQKSNVEEEDITGLSHKARYYFDTFLPNIKESHLSEIKSELKRYSDLSSHNIELSNAEIDELFFNKVVEESPEFPEQFKIYMDDFSTPSSDLMEFIINNSELLNKSENEWMKKVVTIIRDTSLYFKPQGQTKIMNEGWASFWHDRLFMEDPISKGNEAKYSVFNAKVVSHRQGGLNPYAVGKTLFEHIKDNADKGKLGIEYDMIKNIDERRLYDKGNNDGLNAIRYLMENYDDRRFIREFLDQEYMDKEKLWVIGKRYNPEKEVIEYYRKSRKSEDFQKLVQSQMYHRPEIEYKVENLSAKFGYDCSNVLMLNHKFEGKPLREDMIYQTLLGIECLWGSPVVIETSIPDHNASRRQYIEHIMSGNDISDFKPHFKRYVYAIRDREFYETEIDDKEDIFE